jgi:hypothetical protein
VNVLANTLPINNQNTGTISDKYPNLFVPAGFTFSIWGIIYLLLAGFVIFQATRAFKSGSQDSFFLEIGPLFLMSCITNSFWLIAWHYEILPLSLILMIILLISLVWTYLRLGIGLKVTTAPEKYMVHLAFSIYLGWISIATIANFTALLVAFGWNRFGMSEQFWAVIMIMTGALIGLLMLFRRNDLFFNLVLIWAFLGISMKRLKDSTEPSKIILFTAICAIVIITISAVTQIARKKLYA